MSGGSAAARLMENALNPLAHGGDGLDAAVALATRVPCWEVDLTDLPSAAAALRRLLRKDG